MSAEQVVITLWRRKWIVLLTVLVASTTTYFVSRELPKVYSASATLFVGDEGRATNGFEAIQSGQVLAKTYAELIQSRNVASEVAEALPGDLSPDEILDRTTFRPIPETQLIVISAEGASQEDAARLANTYAVTFAEYAGANLERDTNGEVSVADAAHTSTAPVRPRPTLYTAIMLVFSLFLGAGLALLRDRLDTRLGSEEELGRELALPVLARIPSLARRRVSRSREQRFLEAFRVLRMNLAFVSPQEPLTTVVVASAAPSEGKSTCSTALARVISEQGRRVVVVEGDLRRPSLAQLYEIGDGAPRGVTHYLALRTRFEQVVHKTSVPNVYLVPAGAIPPNPSTLLQGEALKNLVADASRWGDFVIVDSPPLSAGADASILAHAAGAVLFVVNHRRGSRAKVIGAIRQLRQTEANIAGLIVNEVPSSDEYDRYYDEPGSASEPTLPESLAAIRSAS